MDASSDIAQALGASAPTVYALRDGRVVAALHGAPASPAALRDFVVLAAGIVPADELPTETAALAKVVGKAALGKDGLKSSSYSALCVPLTGLKADILASMEALAAEDRQVALAAAKIAAAYVRRAYEAYPRPISAQNALFVAKLEPVKPAKDLLELAGFQRNEDLLTPLSRNRAAIDLVLKALDDFLETPPPEDEQE